MHWASCNLKADVNLCKFQDYLFLDRQRKESKELRGFNQLSFLKVKLATQVQIRINSFGMSSKL